MSAAVARVDEAIDFLHTLYDGAERGQLIVWTTDKTTRAFSVGTPAQLERAATHVTAMAQLLDAYIGVGLQSSAPEHGRGTADTVAAIPGLWVDIDIAGPAHAETALPPTIGDALSILTAIPLAPTLIVDSGHGAQVWYLWKEPWRFDSDDERRAAASMVKRFQAVLRREALSHGWKIDPTADLARVLRLPGTINHKLGERRPVRVIERDDAARYNPDDFAPYLPDEEALGWVAPATPVDDGDFAPAHIERIMAGCAWMRHAREQASTLREPEWYAQLSIAGRCVDGQEVAHELSAPHPGYDATTTDKKLQRALTASGPRTCRYIRDELGAETCCASCEHWGKIKTPLVLGRKTLIFMNGNGNGHHDEPAPPANGPPAHNTDKPTRPTRYARTDTGNAERFAARYRGQVLFNWQREVWHRWSGTHWQEDITGAVEQLAKATVRAIPAEAEGLEGAEYAAALKWAATSESDGKRQAMVRLARSEEGIPVLQRALDRDPWLLNCQNGTLDLRTGRLRAHDPDDLITRIVNVDYTPAATCPTFLAFLSRIFDGDAQLIGYVQRLVGYSLTGSIREQLIAICYGTGANGKSTFLRVFRTLLGDYAREANADSFMEQRGESIREDIADLDGARFVAASETADGRRLSEALVKKMTGGERLRARRLYENGWEFDPQFKVWLSTNHRPEIRGTEHAIWRRIRLIPFTVTIPDTEQDKDLAEKLEAELPGILAWAVAGCAEWQRAGLQDPPAVTNATAGYRRDMDLLADWVDTRCELHRSYRESAKALYADYVAYCEGNGDEPIKQRTFGVRLTDRGCGETKGTGGVRLRTGIRLRGDGAKPTQAELESGTSGTSGTKNGKPYIENHSRNLQELNATSATSATTSTLGTCSECGRDLVNAEEQAMGMHASCWEDFDEPDF